VEHWWPSGDGKKALALQIAAAHIRQEIPAGLINPEMSREEFLQRLWLTNRLCASLRVNRTDIVDAMCKL